MKIELVRHTIREVVKNYVDNEEEGVIGYDGNLNIRPKYQREFVYNQKKQNAVIDTIFKGFPLNVMYWVKNEDGTYEVLDGQQRTISFCKYVEGEFSIQVDGNPKYFHSLLDDEKQKFLDYELMIYVCEGTDSEKLDWFKIINIGGAVLTDQELRNAIYAGTWLTDAKSRFSKTNCPASLYSKGYAKVIVNRQELLERALEWICERDKFKSVEEYMSAHQHDINANELLLYFKAVIDWVKATFTKYRKEMETVNWGYLYNHYHNNTYDTKALEKEISELMMDDDVTKKSGVYMYVLTREEKYLNVRAFTSQMKTKAYERQKGECAICKKKFDIDEMEADHIIPWSDGGKTNDENCQMLCKDCNRKKSNK